MIKTIPNTGSCPTSTVDLRPSSSSVISPVYCQPTTGSKFPLIRPRSRHNFGCAKRKHHNEDAVYCDADFQIVADGVGGTAISSAKFAKQLVRNVANLLKWKHKESQLVRTENYATEARLRHFLQIAAKKTRRKFELCEYVVAAALNVAFIDQSTRTLHVLTVGDTKTIVVRSSGAVFSSQPSDDNVPQVVFESTSSVREFNSPNTICSCAEYSMEANALYESFELQPNDFVLTFSDGVTDNLFQHEIVGLIAQQQAKEQVDAQTIAKEIVSYCFRKAKSRPFPEKVKSTGVKKLLSFQFRKSPHHQNQSQVNDWCASYADAMKTSPFALNAALELKQRMEMYQSETLATTGKVIPFPKPVVEFVEAMAFLSKQAPMLNKEHVCIDRYTKVQAVGNVSSLNGLNGIESLYSAPKLLFIAKSRMLKLDDTTIAVCIV